ncbi:hypothetical protein GCM10022251_08640 [Phytohabitans flavus]|uniref:PPE family domain-containing protein n=1 Tax=Phytohabitans flavus TaxID=1076124 RepID=A0A6F8Y1L6_9ACTN|nr:hypothetical protein Pflav_063570 [Phytohabitans flavus]
MAWERSGVPGGQTRTSWFERDLPAMWRLLENQQSDDHWRLVAGWRKASELTATHLRRLEQYRTNLAEAWPPDRNAAASAYVARLDFLIENVRTTHDVAAANYTTLSATVGALASARRDLKPLYDEYVATSGTIEYYSNRAAFNAGAEAPTVIGAAPAGPQDLERLNNRARAIMYTLSHTLIEAEAAIRQPPTYPAGNFRDPGDADVYGRQQPMVRNSEGFLPGTDSTGRVDSASGRAGGLQAGDSDVGANGMHPTPPALDARESGIIAPGSAIKTNTPGPRSVDRSDGLATPGLAGGTTPRALAPGGVIGGVPGSATRPPRDPIRVNPVGGVIASNPIASPQFMGQSVCAPISGQAGDERSERIRHAKPDTRWQVAQGVPEVIVPRAEPRFDPGPAIGLDR